MPLIPPAQLADASPGETSERVAARVAVARMRAVARQGMINAQLDGKRLEQHAQAQAEALALLQRASARLGWSARAYHRCLRVARTLADLAGHAQIEAAEVAEAVQLRRGLDSGA